MEPRAVRIVLRVWAGLVMAFLYVPVANSVLKLSRLKTRSMLVVNSLIRQNAVTNKTTSDAT